MAMSLALYLEYAPTLGLYYGWRIFFQLAGEFFKTMTKNKVLLIGFSSCQMFL
jgi:hypothetical protein